MLSKTAERRAAVFSALEEAAERGDREAGREAIRPLQWSSNAGDRKLFQLCGQLVDSGDLDKARELAEVGAEQARSSARAVAGAVILGVVGVIAVGVVILL